MSSHHFVREGQEPALLIDTADISKFPFLEQIAGWNPVIIAMEKSVPSMLANSVHFDHLLSPEKPEKWDMVTSSLPYLSVHQVRDDQINVTISEIISGSSCKELFILVDEPLSLDQLESYYGDMGLTVFTPEQKWIRVIDRKYRAWFPQGSRILFKGTGVYVNGEAVEDVFVLTEDGSIVAESRTDFWIGSEL